VIFEIDEIEDDLERIADVADLAPRAADFMADCTP